MAVYMLHYDKPLRRGNGEEARHYTGWCQDQNLARRIAQHRSGRGHSAFTEAMARIGSVPTVAYVIWGADRLSERVLKSNGHFRRRCPICNPELVQMALPDEYFAPHLGATVPKSPSAKPARRTGGRSSASSPEPASPSSRRGRKRTAGIPSARSPKVEGATGG
jgi:hypothetical protein